jgi:hypothetical protein
MDIDDARSASQFPLAICFETVALIASAAVATHATHADQLSLLAVLASLALQTRCFLPYGGCSRYECRRAR